MRIRALAVGVLIVVSAACDFGGVARVSANDVPLMSASINGTQWKTTKATAIANSNGIEINALPASAASYGIDLKIFNIATPGTYPLGVNSPMFGGNVIVSNGSGGNGWSTPQSGAAGELTITTITSSRVAGTFAFTAIPISGTAVSLVATAGAFDMPLTGSPGALPANAGRKFTAAINGVPFNAAFANFISGSDLYFSGYDLDRTISIKLANVSATGSYALSTTDPVRTIQILGTPGSATATWTSQSTGGSGSVTITSFTASRVIGTFAATLVPLSGGATGNVTITGDFNMGRP